jgi:hypothetical protein
VPNRESYFWERPSGDGPQPFKPTVAEILAVCHPTGADCAYAWERGYVTAPDVVALMLARWNDSFSITPVEEDLALLLSDDQYRVLDLLSSLQQDQIERAESRRMWRAVFLSTIVRGSRLGLDVDDALIDVYIDFDYDVDLLQVLPAPLKQNFYESADTLRARRIRFVSDELEWLSRVPWRL